MANQRSIANGEKTRFGSGEEAAKQGRKGGTASGIARRQYAMFRESFKERMTQERMAKIFNALCEKAENGDVQAAAFLRDTMGEKPTDTMEISGGEPFEVNIRVIE